MHALNSLWPAGAYALGRTAVVYEARGSPANRPRRCKPELPSSLRPCAFSYLISRSASYFAFPSRPSSDMISSPALRLVSGRHSEGIPCRKVQFVKAEMANSSSHPFVEIISTSCYFETAGLGPNLLSPRLPSLGRALPSRLPWSFI